MPDGNIPLKIFITRLHREHVNRFAIDPLLTSTEFVPLGTMGVEYFTPDKSGEFKMHNVGHGYQGDFTVVDTVDEASSVSYMLAAKPMTLMVRSASSQSSISGYDERVDIVSSLPVGNACPGW